MNTLNNGKGNDMSKVLDILNERLSGEGVEIKLGERDGEITVNAILEGMGEDEDGAIVCEISQVAADDEAGDTYYSFYTVIADQLEESTHAGTVVNLNTMNAELLIGAYGILTETGTIYHKYVCKSLMKDDEQTAALLYSIFVDVVASVYNDYDRVFASIAE